MRTATLLLSFALLLSGCQTATPAPSPTASVRPTAPATLAVKPTASAANPVTKPTSATVELEKGGSFSFTLRADKAPKTVANFTSKANSGAYTGLTFHRVEANFVVQGGDPKGNGSGGGQIASEYNDLPFLPGAVGIARGQDPAINNDMQFFVCIGVCDFLNGKYTNFGQVTSGMEIVKAIKIGDKIKSVKVTPGP